MVTFSSVERGVYDHSVILVASDSSRVHVHYPTLRDVMSCRAAMPSAEGGPLSEGHAEKGGDLSSSEGELSIGGVQFRNVLGYVKDDFDDSGAELYFIVPRGEGKGLAGAVLVDLAGSV